MRATQICRSRDDARSIRLQTQLLYILAGQYPDIRAVFLHSFCTAAHEKTDTFALFPPVLCFCFGYATYSYCELPLYDCQPCFIFFLCLLKNPYNTVHRRFYKTTHLFSHRRPGPLYAHKRRWRVRDGFGNIHRAERCLRAW